MPPAQSSGGDDELQEIRDNFFVGNFQKALTLSESSVPTNDLAQGENDALYARCCFALGRYDPLKSMQASDNAGQRATALLAVIRKSPKEQQRAQAKEHLLKLAKESQDLTCLMLACIITAEDGSYTEAVQMAKTHSTLEMQALTVFFALMCNQVSLADKFLKEMSSINDDSVAYRLAFAAVKLATGESEEAYLTYCDLAAQYPIADGDDSGFGSLLLLTGKAVANMQRSMYSEAIEDLQRALAAAPKDADVLVNLCSCATNLKKTDEFNQYYAKLLEVAPAHPYVVKTEGMSQVFARFKATAKA
jgi:Flp pilus assembly protein TadD